ncbi:EAL domain-containing protein [Clostridiaceae bacterium 35-E11]
MHKSNEAKKTISTQRQITPFIQPIFEDETLFSAGPITVFQWRAEETLPIMFVSSNVHQFGYEAEALMNDKIAYLDMIYHEDRKRVMEEMAKNKTLGEIRFEQDYRIVCANGEIRWVYDCTVMKKNYFDQIDAYYGYILDITERKKSEEKLKMAKKVFDYTIEGIVITDIEGTIQWVNPAFTKITGYDAQEAIGKNPRILRSQRHHPQFYRNMWHDLLTKGQWQGEIWNRRKSGETYPEWLTISAVKDDHGKTIQYVSVFNDITERIKQEEHIKYQAYHDALTGLPNRYLFKDRLGIALAQAHRSHQKIAVLFLDIDRFKRINDTLGHALGDILLQEVAKRFKECVNEGDTVARLGGDEFTILLEDIQGIKNVLTVVHKLFHALDEPFVLKNHEIYATTSIGISLYPDDGQDIDTLMKNADIAMYRAKESGRDNYQLYTSAMNAVACEQLKMENDMYRGLEREEFILYYQPQVEAHTGKIIGAEVLIRWRHPDLGMIPPGKFIPLTEETGFIVSLGNWILHKACEQIKTWQIQGLPAIPISVNLSPLQFKQKKLVENIVEILKKTDIEARYLELEITETNAMIDPRFTIKTLEQLKNMGIKIAIDDFGTGYSSLAYFKNFPVHKLKIDQSFIREIDQDRGNQAIVSAIIAMARSLGLKSIAEGVETEAQLNYLKVQGCNQIQGYFFSPPVPADKFEKILRTGYSK